MKTTLEEASDAMRQAADKITLLRMERDSLIRALRDVMILMGPNAKASAEGLIAEIEKANT